MSFPCSVCANAQVEAISSLILSRTPLRNIASRFPGTTKSALGRHRKHVAGSIVKAVARIPIPRVEPAEIERFEDSLLAKVSRLEADARRLGERAEAEGDLRAALVAIDKLLDVAKLMHELMPSSEAAEPVKISFSFAGSGWNAPNASSEPPGAAQAADLREAGPQVSRENVEAAAPDAADEEPNPILRRALEAGLIERKP